MSETNKKINPITGLPEPDSVYPVTGLSIRNPLPKNSGVSLASQHNVRYKDDLQAYKDYNVSLSPFLDLEEERAKRQSRTEKWRNGTAKMFTTAFGSFAEGTVGLIDGIAEALTYGDATKLYDNSVGNAVDDMNEWMQNNFPNYYTQEEQNAKGLAALGYANFWADKALNGVGYMLGTAASVYTLGGASKIAGGAAQGSAALRGLRLSKAIVTGTEASKMLSGGSQLAARASTMGKQAALGMTSAFAESSVEAREILHSTEERLKQEEAARLGVNVNNLPKEVLADIKSRATNAANLGFGMNMVTVGFSNMVLFGKVIAPGFFDMRKAGGALTKAGKDGAWAVTKFGAKDAAKLVGEGLVTEGFQEGTQFAIQEQALNMADSLNWDFDRALGIPEAMDALFTGYEETFKSKEGLDSVMVGAIIGMFGGGAGSIRSAIENKKNTPQYQKLAEALNNPDLFRFAKKAESVQAQGAILAEMQKAYDANDHKTFRDLQAQLIYEHIDMHMNAGTLDAFLERLDDEAAKSPDDFFKDWAVPDAVTKGLTEAKKMQMKSDLIEGLKKRVNQVVDLKAKLDSKYSIYEPTALQKAMMSEEEKNDLLLQKVTTEAYKKVALQASLNFTDIDGRVAKLQQELNALSDVNINEDDISPLAKQAEKEAEEEFERDLTEEEVADIEKKRQEELDANGLRPNSPDVVGRSESFSGEKVEIAVIEVDENGEAPIGNAEVAGYKVHISTKQGDSFRYNDNLSTTFKTFEEAKEYANKFISKENKQKEINAKYDEELAAKRKEKTAEQKSTKESKSEKETEFDRLTKKYDVREELRLKSLLDVQVKIAKARAKLKQTDPSKLDEFDEKAKDFLRLLGDRTAAINALNNLQASPEERESYLKTKLAEEKAKVTEQIDKKVDELIKNTTSHADLIGKKEELEAAGVSEEALKKLTTESTRRAGLEKKYAVDKLYTKSLKDLKAMDRSTLEPWQKELLDEHIKDKEESGEEGPAIVTKKPSSKPKTSKKTSRKRSERKVSVGKTMNEEEEDDEDTKPKKKKSAPKGKTEAKKRAPAKKKEGTDVEYHDRFDGTSTRSSVSKGGPRIGEFEMLNGRIVVDENGNPITATDGIITYSSINGQDPFVEGRELLAKGVVKEGTKVKIRPVETDYWRSEGRDAAKSDNAVEERRPIFVYVEHNGKDVAIGMLKGPRNGQASALRHQVHLEVTEAEENDTELPEITTTVQAVRGSIFSAVTEDGEKFFYNPLESLGPNTMVGVVRMNRAQQPSLILDKTSKQLALGNLDHLSQEERDELYEWALGLERTEKSPLQGMLPGMVVYVHKNPNGDLKLLAGHTATLTDPDQSQALELLQQLGEAEGEVAEELLRQFSNLVGLNKVLSTDPNGMANFMQIDIINVDDVSIPVLGFKAVDETGRSITHKFDKSATKTSNRVIRIPLSVVSKLLAGQEFDTLGELIFDNKQMKGLTSEQIEEAEKILYNLIAEVEVDNEGLTNLKGKSYNIKPEVAKKLLRQVPDLLRNLLARKKYHIDADQLYSNPAYLEELVSPVDGNEDVGSKGKIATDNKAINGNVLTDIGVDFAEVFEVNGEEYSNKVAPTSQRTSTKTKNKNTYNKKPAKKKDKVKVSEDAVEFNGNFYEVDVDKETITNVKTGKVISNTSSTGRGVIKKYKEGQEETESKSKVKKSYGGKEKAKNSKAKDKVKPAKKSEVKKPAKKTKGANTAKRNSVLFRTGEVSQNAVDVEAAKTWLRERGIDVSVYDTLETIGDTTVHGYVQDASVHLWSGAEVGTEYHEAFHVVFRSMLNDTQRAALYAEEKASEAVSKEELQKLAEQFPNLSPAEVENLAYEERMAEKFRNYVLTEQATATTLGGKIRKFFKDLWNYIKAILGFKTGVNQLFSLIESNKIPKKFVRNAKILSGKAYRVVEGYENDYETHFDMVKMSSSATIYHLAEQLDGMKQTAETAEARAEIVKNTIGEQETTKIGSVGRHFLENSFYIDIEGRPPASYNVIQKLVSIVENKNEYESPKEFGKAIKEILEANNLKVGLPLTDQVQDGLLFQNISDENEEGFYELKSEEELNDLGYVFFEIASKWRGTVDAFGNVKPGFREQVVEDIKAAGFNIKEQKILHVDEENIDDVLREDEHDQQDKYYFAESIEFNVKDKMGAALRQLISSLASPVQNQFGFKPFLNVDEVYKAVVAAVVDSQNFSEMLDKLEMKAASFPELSAVYEYIKDEATPKEQAVFRSFFSLGYSNQKFAMEESIEREEGEEVSEDGGIDFKIIGVDVKTAMRSVFTEWKLNAVQTKRKKDNPIFIETKDPETKKTIRTVDDSTDSTGMTRTSRVEAGYKLISSAVNHFGTKPKELRKNAVTLSENEQFNNLVEGLARTTWALGLEMGEDEKDAASKIKTYLLNTVRKEDRLNEVTKIVEAIDTIISSIYKTTVSSSKNIQQILGPKNIPIDFFTKETSSVRILGEIKASFRSPTAVSQVDPSGKKLYPYNMRTQLNSLIRDLNNPNSAYLEKIGQDEFIAGLPNMQQDTGSELYNALRLGTEVLETFTVNSLSTIHGTTYEYKKMTPRDSILTRLNLYLNNNQKEGWHAIPTQETRGRMDVIKMRKRSLDKARSKEDRILSLLLRDLHRLNQDPELKASLENGKRSPNDVFIFGDAVVDFVITPEMSSIYHGHKVSEITHLLDKNDAGVMKELRNMAAKIVSEVIPSMRSEFMQELRETNIYQVVDDALNIKYPKEVAAKINAGEIKVIQGRKEEINSTKNNLKALSIGGKYYYAQYSMDKATTFEEFAAAYGGKQKALKLLGIDSVEDATPSLKEFVEGKKKLTLYNLTEISKEDAGVEDGQVLNRVNSVWRNKYKTVEDFIDNFIFDDAIARSEMVAMFRGGISQAKNLTDMYKRMGLLNTPGTEMLIEGEIALVKAEEHISEQLQDEDSPLSLEIQEIENTLGGKQKMAAIQEAKDRAAKEFIESLDPSVRNYGMLKVVKQASVDKFVLMDAVHTLMAESYRTALLEDKNLNYSEEEVDNIVAQYTKEFEDKDITDGIALISPIMAKKMREGKGIDPLVSKEWEAFVESNYTQSDFGYSEPYKPFHADLNVRETTIVEGLDENGNEITRKGKVLKPDLHKNSYMELRPELVAGNPVLQELYDRMMGIGQYKGMGQIHLINTVSAKKADKYGMVKLDPQLDENGDLGNPGFAGAITEESVLDTDGSKYILPQTISEKDDFYTRFNRQIRKDTVANLFFDENYKFDGEDMLGEEMFNLYQKAVRELLETTRREVDAMLGVDKLLEDDTQENRLNFYRKVKQFFIQQKIERGELDDNMEEQLEIVGDGFRMPINTPGYEQAFESLITAVYKQRVLKLRLPGKELVQDPGIGPVVKDPVTGKMRELRFLSVEETPDGGRIGSAECLIGYDVAKRYGIKPGDDISKLPENLREMIGYRIPHQGKSSTLILKVVGFLPKGYSKTIMVPGNITVQMGSDFDIDKMFVLMREAIEVARESNVNTNNLKNYSIQDVLQIFEENPDLRSIGTEEEYLEYLNSVFPNSTTKNILYHGASSKFDEFSLKTEARASLTNTTRKGIYLSDDLQTAKTYKVSKSTKVVEQVSYLIKELEEALGVADHGLNEAITPMDGASAIAAAERFASRYDNGATPENILGAFTEEFFSEGHSYYNLSNTIIESLGVSVTEFLDLLRSNNLEEITNLFETFKKTNPDTSRVVRVLANTTNPVVTTNSNTESIVDALSTISDKIDSAQSVIAQNVKEGAYLSDAYYQERPSTSYILFNSADTLILGSKQDISKFKAFKSSFKETGVYQAVAPISNIEELKGASKAQIRNTLFEVVYSISSDIKHAGETLAPLDTALLEDIVQNVLGKSIESRYSFANPLIEIEMERKFKMAKQLVGIYANGISGLAVAMNGKTMEGRGLQIHESKVINVENENGEIVRLDRIQAVSPLTGKSTLYGMIKRLSASVDAGTTPLQDALNDNTETANAIIYLESIGMDEESISLLLNNPYVLEFVALKNDRKGTKKGSTFWVLADMEKADYYSAAKSYKDSNSKTLLKSDLKKVYSDSLDGKASRRAEKHFEIFISAYIAGSDLAEVYKAITPDVLDSISDYSAMEEYRDSQQKALQKGAAYIVDQSQIEQFISGDAYEMQVGYMDMFDHISNVLGQLFSSPHVGVQNAKQLIKNLIGKQELTAKEHKMLSRALYWYSVSRPVYNKAGEDINPLAELLTTDKVANLYDVEDNLWSRLKALKKKNPELAENAFIKLIGENDFNENEKARLYRIQLNIMEVLDSPARNNLIRAFKDLIENPEFYAEPTKTSKKKKVYVSKIISGGQTGADSLGLKVGKALGIETGGTAPKGYRTEDGSNEKTLKGYGLKESKSSNYTDRTRKNVQNSDATVLFGNMNSAGSKATINMLEQLGKPYIVNPSAKKLNKFLNKYEVETLNVAGNRGSKLTTAQQSKIEAILTKALDDSSFGEDENSNELKIKQFAEDLIINALVSNGMAPGYNAYHRFIPLSFFEGLTGKSKNYTLRDHLMREFNNTKNNPDALLDGVLQIIQNFGLRKNEMGSTLVDDRLYRVVDFTNEAKYEAMSTVTDKKFFGTSEEVETYLPGGYARKTDGTIKPESKAARKGDYTLPLIVVGKNKTNEYDKFTLYALTKYGYVELRPMGLNNQLIEVNLRDAKGKISDKSIVPERDHDELPLTLKLFPDNMLIENTITDTEGVIQRFSKDC